ncbi:MAG: hypothetical protein AAF224_14260 [Pseudomonadota bacterium]
MAVAQRKLGDLLTIHPPDHPQNDPAISNLSDEDLVASLLRPENGDLVTVKGNRVFDGNTRVNEAIKRGFADTFEVPVDELLDFEWK